MSHGGNNVIVMWGFTPTSFLWSIKENIDGVKDDMVKKGVSRYPDEA